MSIDSSTSKSERSSAQPVGANSDATDVRTALWPVQASARSFRLHAFLLLIFILGTLLVVSNGHIALPDEGVYAAQADNLAEGSWAEVRPALDLDPDGSRFAIGGAHIRGDNAIPYARHPAYPLMLAPIFAFGGYSSALALSAVGSWAAAVAGGLLARRLKAAIAVPTLWILGAASPLLFDSSILIAHSLAAALAGWMLVTLARAVFDGRLWNIVPAAVCAASLVLVRSEGLLVAYAAAAGTVLISVRLRDWRRTDVRGVLAGVIIGAVALTTYLIEAKTVAAITGVGNAHGAALDRQTGAWSAAWVSLLRPWHGDARYASPALVLAAVCPLLAVAAVRFSRRGRVLAQGLIALAAVSALLAHLGTPQLITGLFAAFPLLLPGLALLTFAELRSPLVRWLVAVCVLASGALLATIYDVGGAAEWGGRFFHVLLPAVVPLAVFGLDRLGDHRSGGDLRFIAAGVILVSLATCSFGIRAGTDRRAAARSVVDTSTTKLARSSRRNPVIAVATLAASDSSRLFWKQASDGPPVLGAGNLGGLLELLEDARDSTDSILLAGDVDSTWLEAIAGDEISDLGWAIEASQAIPTSRFHMMWLTR